jgi:hypothetical protein
LDASLSDPRPCADQRVPSTRAAAKPAPGQQTRWPDRLSRINMLL